MHSACCALKRTRRRAPCIAAAASSSSSPGSSSPASPPAPTLLSTLLSTYFLPLALVGGVVAGIAAPAAGAAAAAAGGALASTAAVFFICGLTTDASAVARAARSWKDVAFGLASILLVSPLLAGPIAARLPLAPPALATGLAVFMCVPTTLSSGVALTTAAGGDSALALVLTLASNLLGVITTPLAVALVFGGGGGALDPTPLLKTLLRAVALPLATGAALRANIPRLPPWAASHKPALARASALALAAVPWMQVSQASSAGVPLPPAQLTAAAGAGVALHCGLLALNFAAASLLRPGRDAAGARCALIVCASQKTLPIACAVLASVVGADAGVAAAPIVGVHLAQVLIDGVLAQVGAEGKSGQNSRHTKTLDLTHTSPPPPPFFSAHRARIALTLLASQKSLTLAVPALIGLYSTPGGPPRGAPAAALATLPLVFVHLLQTLMDSVLAGRWGAGKKD